MDTSRISLDPSALTRWLALITMAIVATSLGMQAYRLIANQTDVPGLPMINLDGEQNLPALFSTGLLLCASLLLALVAMLERGCKAPDASKWAILACGFLVMGMDEALSIHEKAIEPLRALLGGENLGIFFFAWVIPGIALVAVLGVFFLPFLFRLPRRTAIAFAVSAAIYLSGALGIELVEGWWREEHGHRNLAYHAMVSLEEGMEMIGVIGFIHALLAYIAMRHGEIRIAFGGKRTAMDATGPALQPQAGQVGALGQ